MFEAHRFDIERQAGGFEPRALAPDPAMQPTRRYTRGAEPVPFVAWGLPAAAPKPTPAATPVPPPPPHAEIVIDGDARVAAAHASGFEKGHALACEELAAERAAIAALVAALDALRPEPPHALALLLAETVGRLVRQVVGEVAVDAALLARRAEAVAALVIDEAGPCRLKMHPDDAARVGPLAMPIEVAPDPGLPPGTVRLDCGDGWIEDGPDGALERLHGLLDRMGAPR